MADLPRLRRHTDGRLAQWTGRLDYAPWHVTVPTGRPVDGDRDDPALCYHTADEQVHGEGWTSLSVVELPEARRLDGLVNGHGIEVEVPAPDGAGWECTALHFPGYDEDRVTIGGIGWRGVNKARQAAARILAACAAVERLRAEHQAGAQ